MNLDDPKLTAFALDELDEPERSTIANAIADSPEAQRYVEGMRELAGELKSEFAAELESNGSPQPSLDLGRFGETSLPSNLIDIRDDPWFWSIGRPLAIAATIALAALIAALGIGKYRLTETPREMAMLPAASEPMEVEAEFGPQPLPEATPILGDNPVELALQPPAKSTQPTIEKSEDIPSPEFYDRGKISADDDKKFATTKGSRDVWSSNWEIRIPQQMPPFDGGRENVESRGSIMGGGQLGYGHFGGVVSNGAVRGAQSDTQSAFNLPAGPLTSAIGGEHRREHAADSPDALTRSGNLAGRVGKLPWNFNAMTAAAPAAPASRLVAKEKVQKEVAQLYASGGIHNQRVAAAPPTSTVVQSFGGGPDIRQQDGELNTAAYDHVLENPFLDAKSNPLSTFSIDVDTASYSNIRRFINEGSLPPKDAVRVEEMINYFTYDYAQPNDGKPFAVHVDLASCPWESSHRLVRVGLKGREIATDKRGASNLVFLLDVSGSMRPAERLPLVKQAMRLLVEKLTEDDRVAIVVYAGASGLALPSTNGAQKDQILSAIESLQSGGSTNGAEGIQLAYKVAADNFVKGGVNRVILATDGDFNVGVTNQGDLVRLIEEKAKSGVFLSVLGVGTDNLKDSTMQKLADKGNGNYAYLDSLDEARKVLVQQMNGTLVTIAKDVKIQVEFNPARVASYRLIGYEKRMLRKEDFNNDKIDAGEIGAGHTVTALYEVVPVGAAADMGASVPPVDPLKYQTNEQSKTSHKDVATEEMLTVKLRYKKPDGDKSELIERAVMDSNAAFASAAPDLKFAAAVAEFGMLLRESEHKGNGTIGAVLEWAEEGKAKDPNGYRAGFIELVRKAQALKKG